MNLPDGEYIVTLEHHPNQGPFDFVATIVEGDFSGKGLNMSFGTIQCDNLIYEEENEN